MQSQDQIRRDQQDYGRSMNGRTLTLVEGGQRRKSAPSPAAPKGHEAFLKMLEATSTPVTFEKISSGEKVTGRVKTSDKFTVSVAVSIGGSEEYITRVLFKHDISEFTPHRPAASEGV